jgi:hypothetical protein
LLLFDDRPHLKFFSSDTAGIARVLDLFKTRGYLGLQEEEVI